MRTAHKSSSLHEELQTSIAPSCSQLCVVLRVLMICGLFSVEFDMFLGIILIYLMLGQSAWYEFIGVASSVTRRHSLTTMLSILWLLQIFCSLFHSIPWGLHTGVFHRCIYWYWDQQLAFVGCSFPNGFPVLLQPHQHILTKTTDNCCLW